MITRNLLLVLLGSLGGQGATINGFSPEEQLGDRQFSPIGFQPKSQQSVSQALCVRINAPNLASYPRALYTAPIYNLASVPYYGFPSVGPSIVNNDDEDSDISVCFFDSPCNAVLFISETIYPFRFCDEPTH